MKKIIFYLLIVVFFASCKSTSKAVSNSNSFSKTHGLPLKSLSEKEVPKPVLTKEVRKKMVAKYKAKIATTPPKKINKKLKNGIEDETEVLIDAVLEEIEANIGVPYRYGGISSSGFDCSGLLYANFKKFDVDLPRTSWAMSQSGVLVDEYDIKKGDFIFFKTGRSRQINHVGIVVEVEEDEVKFIHSSSSRGVMISSTKENYYNQSYAQSNRIIY